MVSRTPRVLARESSSMGSLSQRLCLPDHQASLNWHHWERRAQILQVRFEGLSLFDGGSQHNL